MKNLIFDVPVHKKGSLKNLKKAVSILKKYGYINIKILQDKKGAFSVEYPKFFLTANSYAYKGFIVSNQIEIINRAKIHNKDLLLYVGEFNKFYIFDPEEVIENSYENRHGYLTMLNWDFKIGKELIL